MVLANFKRYIHPLLVVFASALLAVGWNWYHLPHLPRERFYLTTFAWWVGIFVAYRIGRALLFFVLPKMRISPFWYTHFQKSLDVIFLFISFLSLFFFSRSDLWSLIILVVTLGLLFVAIDLGFSAHPDAKKIRAASRNIFVALLFLFFLNALFQWLAQIFNILGDKEIRNILVFRTFGVFSVSLILFSLTTFLVGTKQRIWKWLGLSAWFLFLAVFLIFWVINIGILYFSGLYLSPVAFEHAEGAGDIIWNSLTYVMLLGYIVCLSVFVITQRGFVKAQKQLSPVYRQTVSAGLFLVGIVLLVFSFSSFKTAPEYVVTRSFYHYFTDKGTTADLPPALFSKLERFGLHYDPSTFYVGYKEKVYSKETPLLPEKFAAKKPNVMIVFFESLSARLVNVYNPTFPDLTPGLVEMADDPHTTVFRNYYNASTPTVNGLLSQLCSFLPPIGHTEIGGQNRLSRHRLFCLPRALRENGYNYAAYLTAVKKTYTNKEGIFESMGADEVWGTTELRPLINQPTLSWGFSDHQTIGHLLRFSEQHAKDPFLIMLSTVDMHAPFTTAKDMINWKDGKNALLNATHTTDDAFRLFWQDFKKSSRYDDTIVIAVADHAMFPSAIMSETFPEDGDDLTFYDRNNFLMYVPDSVLPKEVTMHASGIDFTPTLLHILGINVPNSFEGHSVFDNREQYPNILGMHEFGLFTSQLDAKDQRKEDYGVPSRMECPGGVNASVTSSPELNLCELFYFYRWKRSMLEEGRLWQPLQEK